MQRGGSRVEDKIAVRPDHGLVPAIGLRILVREHAIGKVASETD